MKNNKYTFKLIDLDAPVNGYFNRVFPTTLMKQLIESPIIQEKLQTRSFFCGLRSREQTSSHTDDLKLSEVCVGVEKIYIEDSQLKIDIEVLDTPMGRVLKELLEIKQDIVKCLPIFEGHYTGHDLEVITELDLRNIYFIAG